MRNQSIYNIAEICSRKGVTEVVLCPGSRCAPLTLAFTRHKKFQCRTFSDERSAGFIALGIAQQTKKPVALVCTSGTAAYNFAPAVAEAYFSQTPLLVFTADRPAEWIAQHDGQTILQANLYGKHVKQSYTLPQHYDHPDDQWYTNRIINEAINLAKQEPAGPVHINAPFREPFYPDPSEPFSYSADVRIIEEDAPVSFPIESEKILAAELSTFRNILVVAGQSEHNPDLIQVLQTTASRMPVLGGALSNLHEITNVIRHADAFLSALSEGSARNLKPDLLISFGKSVISKSLKLFLRKFPTIPHWHIQSHPGATDPFQNLSKILVADPIHFFSFINSLTLKTDPYYLEQWKIEERRIAKSINEFFPQPEFSELELVKIILSRLPSPCHLHLANSMSVRYAEYMGVLPDKKNITVFSNRGTSGIDGCTSTAVGHSLSSESLNILITGDLAFFL
ncbi:2-succinyl-5-enolpyruvyl-6-hydroxy-3-cyclohexene-1-carboxylic-acid synthase [Oscillatoria amoena NRMC-F 0135]|nr:2-succinyl-5-enolpyruvyl-6-hydroxy-3-cyclohexene-1-carboxylic-acid synthase [Oscillatoria amoena NRMC-F 0135]